MAYIYMAYIHIHANRLMHLKIYFSIKYFIVYCGKFISCVIINFLNLF